MPYYTAECVACGASQDYFRHVDARADTPRCDCGAPTRQVIISAPMGFVQRDCRYDSPVDGRPITSWAQRRDDLARNGCQEYDPEMRKDADRARREADAALERSVDHTVEAAIEKMPNRKRERLHNELMAGATAELERK
jgi:hypothetical protein